MEHDDDLYPDWTGLEDPDPTLTTTVELTYTEVLDLLDWTYHLDTYSLAPVGDIIRKLEAARDALQERSH